MANITDIKFDLATREIVMKNDDFELTPNPSVQNAGILEFGQGFNPFYPMFGIGISPQVIGGNRRQLVYELNRWKSQCYQDGATFANWTIAPHQGDEALFTNISYL